MHVGASDRRHSYSLDDKKRQDVSLERDLGVYISTYMFTVYNPAL